MLDPRSGPGLYVSAAFTIVIVIGTILWMYDSRSLEAAVVLVCIVAAIVVRPRQ